jgi:hypothetical protein
MSDYAKQPNDERLADFVLIGRAAVLHHDFPLRLAADSRGCLGTIRRLSARLARLRRRLTSRNGK